MARRLVLFLVVFAGVGLAQSYLSVHGEDIEVRVDTVNGYFGIGTYPDGLRLTYDFGDTILPSSNFVVKIDGVTYGLAGVPADYALEDYQVTGFPEEVSLINAIKNRWSIDSLNITIDQYLRLEVIDTNEFIRVRYAITNMDSTRHNISLEHKWDVCLNNYEGNPVVPSLFIPGLEPECPFFSLIPGEMRIHQYEEPDSGLIANLIFSEFDAIRPNMIAFGPQAEILPSVFDIDTSFICEPYDSLAVLLRWNEINIASGLTHELITYYGTCENWRNLKLPLGWNIVSNASILELDVDELYGWDNSISDYYTTILTEPEKGYWAMITDTFNVNLFPLFPPDSFTDTIYTDSLYRGWNLIGSARYEIPRSLLHTDPPGLIMGVFGWDPIGYDYFVESDSLLPYRGYWVLSSGDGEIIVGP